MSCTNLKAVPEHLAMLLNQMFSLKKRSIRTGKFTRKVCRKKASEEEDAWLMRYSLEFPFRDPVSVSWLLS